MSRSVEAAAAQHGNAERRVPVGGYEPPARVRLCVGLDRAAEDAQARARAQARERERLAHRRGCHARQRAQPGLEARSESAQRGRVLAKSAREVEPRRERALRLEAERRLLKPREGSEQQARAAHQHHR